METPKITYTELKQLIDSHGEYVLIDVREADELEYGAIPTAINIPVSEIESAIALPDADFKEKYGTAKFKSSDHLIFYCRTGGRSSQVTQWAIGQGFLNSVNYKGSIWEWSEHDPNVKRYGPGA